MIYWKISITTKTTLQNTSPKHISKTHLQNTSPKQLSKTHLLVVIKCLPSKINPRHQLTVRSAYAL